MRALGAAGAAGAEVVTKRLTCRRPTAADEAAYRELLLHPNVREWLRPPPLPAYTEDGPGSLLVEDMRHWEDHGFGPWVLLERAGGEFVGRGGLSWTTAGGRLRVQLPWAIVPGRWNEGLATEAAEAALACARELGFGEVISFTLPDNAASRRVMEKLGMVPAERITHAGLDHVLYVWRSVRS